MDNEVFERLHRGMKEIESLFLGNKQFSSIISFFSSVPRFRLTWMFLETKQITESEGLR